MGTEILTSYSNLQHELEQAKDSLKGVDKNIKKLIGRDPSEPPARIVGIKRGVPNEQQIRNRNRNFENDEPVPKRKNSGSVFSRLSDRIDPSEQRQMISKVIVTPKEVPSRQAALAKQSKDEKSKARNRRMFGALLGTLQKFQQEETKLKGKEDKRAQLEKKIEEHEIKEKEEIKKEKQELFLNRRKKQAEIKVIELKMNKMKGLSRWEEKQRQKGNFIMTKAKPPILYLPRKLTDESKKLLDEHKDEVEKIIENKKAEVLEELTLIEERMKRNFETKTDSKENDKKMESSNESDDEENEEKLEEKAEEENKTLENVDTTEKMDTEENSMEAEKENGVNSEETQEQNEEIYPAHEENYSAHEENYPAHKENYPAHENIYPAYEENYPAHEENFSAHEENYPAHEEIQLPPEPMRQDETNMTGEFIDAPIPENQPNEFYLDNSVLSLENSFQCGYNDSNYNDNENFTEDINI